MTKYFFSQKAIVSSGTHLNTWKCNELDRKVMLLHRIQVYIISLNFFL